MSASYDTNAALEAVKRVVSDDKIFVNEPLCYHTTFEIGGPADIFVTPETTDECVQLLQELHKLSCPVFVLGGGSDLLVSDAGYRGVIICTKDLMASMYLDGNDLVATSGCMLKDVSDFACEAGLSGFEFACGIPGTVGGACFMNAGAYGGQISDCLHSVVVCNMEGEVFELKAQQLNLGYRQSRVKDDKLCVLTARFSLSPKAKEEIQATIDDLMRRRIEKQPLEWPSAGSTFKRPEGHFAGKLIQDSGMQGHSVGGAQVSTKHAGFVINKGGATANDVRSLIHKIQAEIKRQFDVDIVPEVRFLGEFDSSKETTPCIET